MNILRSTDKHPNVYKYHTIVHYIFLLYSIRDLDENCWHSGEWNKTKFWVSEILGINIENRICMLSFNFR